jgi:hypothetical protein
MVTNRHGDVVTRPFFGHFAPAGDCFGQRSLTGVRLLISSWVRRVR